MKKLNLIETNEILKRKIMELEGQLASSYHFARLEILKSGTPHMLASGVLLRLNGLGGRELIKPVVIRGGLSKETISALIEDFKRSYSEATLFKP